MLKIFRTLFNPTFFNPIFIPCFPLSRFFRVPVQGPGAGFKVAETIDMMKHEANKSH